VISNIPPTSFRHGFDDLIRNPHQKNYELPPTSASLGWRGNDYKRNALKTRFIGGPALRRSYISLCLWFSCGRFHAENPPMTRFAQTIGPSRAFTQ